MSDILLEQDPAVRESLRQERDRILEFFEHPAFKAGKSIVDGKFKDAMSLILDLPMDDAGAEQRLHQTIGEARALRDWNLMFTDRLAEIETSLGASTPEDES
jgi:hypothetical protein